MIRGFGSLASCGRAWVSEVGSARGNQARSARHAAPFAPRSGAERLRRFALEKAFFKGKTSIFRHATRALSNVSTCHVVTTT